MSVKGGYGGKYVEDKFTILSTGLVERLVSEFNCSGEGATVMRINYTCMMMAPPWVCLFRTVRGAAKMPTQLLASACFMGLVDRRGPHGPLTPRWAFDESVDWGGDANRLAYKIALAVSLVKYSRTAVPQHMAQFATTLLNVV